MNEINIIPSDARYVALNEIFLENGYNSHLCTPEVTERAENLILPIRCTLADEELSKILSRLDRSAIVFSGQVQRVRRFFNGRIIDYSSDERFLDRNAYITAECAVSIVLNELEKSLSESKCAIIGYGRIGKHLSALLKAFNADVTVLARREESRKQACLDGCNSLEISELSKNSFDIILNTVPEPIIPKSVSDAIPEKSLVYDLASLPGGFEEESFPKRALALPGKMKPISAARAIFDFVESYISNERK